MMVCTRKLTRNNIAIQKRVTGSTENPLKMLKSSADITTSTPQIDELTTSAWEEFSRWREDSSEI
jgi:hypothetical protein